MNALPTTLSRTGCKEFPYTSSKDSLSEQKAAARIGTGFGVESAPSPGVAIWIVHFDVKGFLQYLQRKQNVKIHLSFAYLPPLLINHFVLKFQMIFHHFSLSHGNYIQGWDFFQLSSMEGYHTSGTN